MKTSERVVERYMGVGVQYGTRSIEKNGRAEKESSVKNAFLFSIFL